MNAGDLDTTPPEWLVDGVIPRVGYGVLWGPSYIGKSLVVDGELALAVCNGVPFFGHAVMQGNVALCLGEGLYDAGVRKQARLERHAREHRAAGAAAEAAGATAPALVPYTDERLLIMPESFTVPQTVVRGTGVYGGDRSYEKALAELRQIPELELLILDAMQDFAGAVTLTSDSGANRFVLGAKRLVRELNCCVLFVHHATVKGDKMIGGQRLFSAADFVIHAAPAESEDLLADITRQQAALYSEKAKYGARFQPIGYEVEPVSWETTGPDGELVVLSTATVRERKEEKEEVRLPEPAPAKRDKRTGVRTAPGQRRGGWTW